VKGFNLSGWAIRHRSFVAYLMLVLLAAGISSFFKLGRNEDPAITIKTMVVQANWPGATLDDTLNQVTERIERKLQETPNLDHLRSYTTAGQSRIFIDITGATPSSAMPAVWYQVRKKVGDIKGTLPPGVVGPYFNDEFGDTYGIVYGFTADGFSHRELRDYVEGVRSGLLQVPDVSKIDLVGVQNEQVYIQFSNSALAGLGINRQDLIQALQTQNSVTPAGVITTRDEKILLRVSGAFRSEKDLLAVNFSVNGRIIRLSDIARVIRTYSDPPNPLFRVNGKPAIGLGIAMRAGGNVVALGGNVHAAMERITAGLPVGIQPVLVSDQPVTVQHSVDEFMEALWEAVAIVLGVSFVSLGLRAGAVVALSIPLVLATVFLVMSISGIDLQRVSLGALIIALGLLVDDAMITVESMIMRLEKGDKREQAATFAYTSTAYPMLTGTLVTIAGFVPIGFARSSAGEYTFSIFAVVAIALITSWFVAVVFAPLLGIWLLPKAAKHHSERKSAGWMSRKFHSVLKRGMERPKTTVAITLGVFIVSIALLRLVPQQFFPASDRPELMVDLKLPQNSSIYASKAMVERFDRLVAHDPDVDHWSDYVGQGAIRFYLPLNLQLPNDYFSQAVVVAKDVAARDRLHAKLDAALQTDFPDVVGRVYPLELGPPVGWPVQYRVHGPDIDRVRGIALELARQMSASPLLEKANYDWIEPARTVHLRVNQDQARILGLSSQEVAQSLSLIVSGQPVTQIRDGIYLIDVVVRADEADRVSLSSLRSLQLAMPNGRVVPLSEVAAISYDQEMPMVLRRDRVPTLTVQANTAPGVLPQAVVSTLAPNIKALNARLPAGYSITVGGTTEESSKSQASVVAVVPVMLLLMLTILMVQLQSFQRLFLVLSVAPLGLIGVVAALLLSGRPLGFVAILGVLALIGMIARNSVILIHQIEVEKEQGLTPWEAIINASASRTRPIMLTAAAAIFGMIPIAPTVFWGPMAFAIMGGLAVATVLTLIFLPALYVAWFRVKSPVPAHEEGSANPEHEGG
jgi:multidrug efflux pump subunit AcrB